MNMAEITAALVKDLRERSGVGMMDCKKALTENDGDIEAAMDWLKAKGLSKAAKKADRIAAEGLVAIQAVDTGAGMTGVAVELNAETDFVGRNPAFQDMVKAVAAVAVTSDADVEALKGATLADGQTVDATITNLIATIGENMSLRRIARVTANPGAVAAYVHNAVTPELGRIGVLVGLQSTADKAKLVELGRKIAMHVAATAPLSLHTEELDAAIVAREKAIFEEQAAASGKPANVVEKMVEGRIRKFFEEVVLTKQAFVMDPDRTVEKLVEDAGKELGAPITITGFVRLALGEGIEKKTEDFAAEVAAAAGQVNA
jgi:elongation factor Ts